MALITKVRYGRTFNLGNYESARLEVEADIDTLSETAADAMEYLKAFIEAAFAEKHPSAPKW